MYLVLCLYIVLGILSFTETYAQLLRGKEHYSTVIGRFPNYESKAYIGSIGTTLDSVNIGGVYGVYSLSFGEQDSLLKSFRWEYGNKRHNLFNIESLDVVRRDSSTNDTARYVDSQHLKHDRHETKLKKLFHRMDSVSQGVLTFLRKTLGEDLREHRVVKPNHREYYFNAKALEWEGYFYVYVGSGIIIKHRRFPLHWKMEHGIHAPEKE